MHELLFVALFREESILLLTQRKVPKERDSPVCSGGAD